MNPETDIVIASGPAGTGKTYLAMLSAIKALKNGVVEKIILTRPAVGVDDEKHGFLPGDLNQKMEPWTRPLFDVLREYYTAREITHMLEEQIIEIAPLAFCRGRNFKFSYVILDEAQNCTMTQLMLWVTRLGKDSKAIMMGDVSQYDIKKKDSRFLEFINLISDVEQVHNFRFGVEDIVRNKFLIDIVNKYEKWKFDNNI